MSLKKLTVGPIVILYILFAYNTLLGGNTETTPQEKQEYERDYKRVTDLDASLSQDGVRDMNAYEAFGDSIDQKWRGRNKELYARLILEICRPLSSGTFKEDRSYELARKYALSALEEPDSIPLLLELDLIGSVTTRIIGPGAPSGDDFAEKRTKDTKARLHAWKRLLEAIDPNWDTDKATVFLNISPSAATGLPAGVDPAAIQDSALRAEYEEAIQLNRQNAEKNSIQYEYHKWLNEFPKSAESYTIRAYSHPPYATEKLEALLNEYQIDQEAKTRIIEAVEKNIEEYQKKRH